MEYIKELLHAITNACYTLRHYPSQVALLLTLFLGWQVYTHDGEIYPGVRVVLETTSDFQLQQLKNETTVVSKAQLMLVAESDRIIDEALHVLLDQSQDAKAVKLAIVHDGTFTLAAQHMMHFSITHTVTQPDIVPAPLLQNEPLSEWIDFLTDLLNDKCVFKEIGHLTDPMAKAREMSHGVKMFAACPVWNVHGVFMGAIFANYDKETVNQQPVIDQMKIAAARVGSALSIKGLPEIRVIPQTKN